MSCYSSVQQRAAIMQRPSFVLFVFFFIGICKEGLACNPEWKENDGKCYLMVRLQYDIRMARRYCFIYGGDLAGIDTNETLSFLQTLVPNELYDYWVSENSTIVGSGSHSVDDGSALHNCPYVRGEQFYSGSCDDQRHFLCEVEENREIACPSSWFLSGTTCYKPMPDNNTYAEARDTCSIQRGTLAILDDLAKEHQVAAVIMGRNTTFLVGAQNEANGTILWSNGKRFQPSCSQCFVDHSTGECLGFQSSADHPFIFSWVHLDCDSQYRYLCEIPPTLKPKDLPPPTTPAPPTTAPPTLPPLQCPHGFNWKVHEASGFCYWETTYETERLNWFQARKFCQNVGGDLATYQDERQELVGLGGAKGHYRGLWFGLKRSTDNVFSWVDGSPFNYTNWNYNEPKLGSTSKFCVVHGADESKWELDYCGVRRWFVCKAPKTTRVTIPDPITPFKKTVCNFTSESSLTRTWYLFEDHCYLVREQSYTWHTAQDFCRDNNGYLLSVHSFEETDFVISLLTSISDRNYWMGLSARGIDSSLEWSDGTPVDFIYWPDGVSTNATEDAANTCVAFNSKKGSWSQAHCNEFKTVLCKRPLNSSYEFTTPEPTPMLPGNCPQNWYPFGNKCFRVYGALRSNRLTYHAAVDACRSEDAELASIHSDEEQDFLVDLMLFSDSAAWIGLRRQSQNLFKWIDDSPLDYSRLVPTATLETDMCIELADYEAGNWKWNHVKCFNKKSYICQKFKDPTLTESSQDPFECTNITGWYRLRSSCYGIFENKAYSWIEAQRKCKEFDADLVTFQNEAVGNFLKKRLTKKDNFLWTGVRETAPNTYGLVNGKALRNSNWLSSQPAQAAGRMENCVTMNSEARWIVKDCKEPRNFVCEWNSDVDSEEEHILSTQKPCPDSFNWVDLGSDVCYTVEEDLRMTWTDAAQYCFRHGAHLASIHSEQELSLVTKYLAKKFEPDEFYIGLAQRNDGSFSWVDGSPLDYTNWDPNRDLRSQLYSLCSKISLPSGLWIPISCFIKSRGAICSVPKNKGTSPEASTDDFLKHEKQDDISSKLTVGGIFGITICVLVIVVIIAVAAYYMCPSTRMRVPLEESDSL